MNDKKLRVGILFGGRSGEHEISLRSASSILKAIDRTKYDIVPLAITRTGKWLSGASAEQLLLTEASVTTSLSSETATQNTDLVRQGEALTSELDVVFPVLHGTFGEDGTIQGLLELLDIAYVGSGVLGSAAGMDKNAMKRLFQAANLPQTPYIALLRSDWRLDPKRTVKRIEKHLIYPLFVKPANLGSSVGISKVHHRSELADALNLAATFDRKLVVEQGVGGPGVKPRELEVAVLGNDAPEASVVGEIVPNREFYDYESKYIDTPENPSVPLIPAKLTRSEAKYIRELAIEAFRATDCSGLARVDFLMEPGKRGKHSKDRIFLNEINTLPGFTSISMFPRLWEASGLGYTDLIDRLLTLARERHAEKAQTAFTR